MIAVMEDHTECVGLLTAAPGIDLNLQTKVSMLLPACLLRPACPPHSPVLL